MGIRHSTIKFLEQARDYLGYSSWDNVTMCELGAQATRKGGGFKREPAKDYFTRQGVIHTSIDITGKYDSLPLDLSKQIDHLKDFDIVSNYGTSEHIFYQYMVFKNVHSFVKEGGVMVHFLPATPFWRKHGFYTYSDTYFKELAEKNNYNVQTIEYAPYGKKENAMIAAVLVKRGGDFISEEIFDTIEGRHRTKVKAGGQNTQ
jgi:hypothetical protein